MSLSCLVRFRAGSAEAAFRPHSDKEERMKTYLSLAPTPIEEDCAQVGTSGYREQVLEECARFMRLLRQKFGPEPEGAWLSVKWFDHDFRRPRSRHRPRGRDDNPSPSET
jgi:hypothetical protein